MANNTIQGQGLIQTNLNNGGTLNATVSGGSLTLSSGYSLSNTGTINVDAGAKLVIDGTLTNLANDTLTGGTYHISGTVYFGSETQINTNAANLVIDGRQRYRILFHSRHLRQLSRRPYRSTSRRD